jgi:hypothetical protein
VRPACIMQGSYNTRVGAALLRPHARCSSLMPSISPETAPRPCPRPAVHRADDMVGNPEHWCTEYVACLRFGSAGGVFAFKAAAY